MGEVARKRYLQPAPETAKATHAELANLFFSEFQQEPQNINEEQPATTSTQDDNEEGSKDTPFQSAGVSDVTYSTRHVEESWLHLLKAGKKNHTLLFCK